MSEKTLHRAICDYIRMRYPEVLFNSDLSGSMRLTIGQAKAMKSLRSNRGFPDLVIYEARGGYHGLFLELKQEGIKLYNKKGKCSTPHIEEQARVLKMLEDRGYMARFAIGFDEAKDLIDYYLYL